jgi:hypothetical protein
LKSAPGFDRVDKSSQDAQIDSVAAQLNENLPNLIVRQAAVNQISDSIFAQHCDAKILSTSR